MKSKPILIISGEPNSIFLEIFFKSYKKKFKTPLILISSLKILSLQMKKLKFKKKIRLIDYNKIPNYRLNNKSINLINVEYNTNKAFNKISKKSNSFIRKSFDIAYHIIESGFSNKLINGPISKKSFLEKKFLGITEYLAKRSEVKKVSMLIYNKKLSVCPVTTHLPLKKVVKKITFKQISQNILLIDKFYKSYRKIKPRMAILGLNPHCESTDNYNEDEKIIKKTVNHYLKLGFKISGPIPADTVFLKNIRKNYDVIIGMYHDQVLTPIKTIYEYDAINITLGLPYLRISPDHGPNEKMLGRNKSNPLSLIQAIKFLDKN